MEPTQWQVAVFVVTLLLGVASVGLRMSGYINRAAGLTLFGVAVAGMAAVVAWWRWPLSIVEVVGAALILVIGVVIWLFVRHRAASFSEVGLELDVSTYRHADILIAQLGGVSGGQLERKSFEHCRIIGPAVLSLHHCRVIDCEVAHDPEDMVWTIPSDEPSGCVFMVDCRFYGCYFEFVGLAVPSDEVARLKGDLTPPAAPQSPKSS